MRLKKSSVTKTTETKKTTELNHLMNHLEPDTQHSLNMLITESSAQYLTDICVLGFLAVCWKWRHVDHIKLVVKQAMMLTT